MNRTQARQQARELFPCILYDTHYKSYEELVRKDGIAASDLLDHIQWNEPLNPGSMKHDI